MTRHGTMHGLTVPNEVLELTPRPVHYFLTMKQNVAIIILDDLVIIP